MKHYNWVKEEIDKLLEAGVIRNSHSSWSAPIIVVPKGDGGKCLVIDYRALNKVMRKFVWPMPKVEDIFSQLNGAKYLSTLDLRAGYHHIGLTADSIPKTAFTYKRVNCIPTKEKRPVETRDIDDDFMREYDEMHKLMEYKQIYDYYEAQRHIQSAMEGDTPVKTSHNRQCINNVRDYDREHDRILNSVHHRLDLGPNMLLGAQQHTTVESAAALRIQDKFKG